MTDARDADHIAELDDFEPELPDDEDRTFPERPCGDPAAHDRLLAVLRRAHPNGHENVDEPAARALRSRTHALEKSLTGCSASLCADAA